MVDVGYGDDDVANAACVVAADWTAPAPIDARVERVPGVADYRPGAFYERELGPVLAVLARVREAGVPFGVVVVDGYVWLDAEGRKGLGAHLHDALALPVVGVAKRPFRGSAHAVEVHRGESARPLYVTAVGIDADEAAARILAMHGPHRVPTLLRLVDQRSRGLA
ncbi:MAG: endonuclease V [Myxococcota bacterium]